MLIKYLVLIHFFPVSKCVICIMLKFEIEIWAQQQVMN